MNWILKMKGLEALLYKKEVASWKKSRDILNFLLWFNASQYSGNALAAP